MASSKLPNTPREAWFTPDRTFVVMRSGPINGRDYMRGDLFDKTGVTTPLLRQLFLNHTLHIDIEPNTPFKPLPAPPRPHYFGTGLPTEDMPKVVKEMWMISVPAWGDSYRNVFKERAAPALRISINNMLHSYGLDGQRYVRLRFHTDQPGFADRLFPEIGVDYVPIAPDARYTTLQYSHRETINSADNGDRVGLLNADLVVSDNLFMNAEKRFRDGWQAIVLLGIRTVLGAEIPPQGVDPRTLLTWAWDHRHQIIRDLEWGKGQSGLPSNLFWESADQKAVVARGFHLHPVAIIKNAQLAFKSTIDGDMLDTFPRDKIAVITNPDEMALIEMSEPSRRFHTLPYVMNPESVARNMSSRASELHRWQFGHRILVKGTEEQARAIDDIPSAAAILRFMGNNTTFLR